jgi:hypothetical protein
LSIIQRVNIPVEYGNAWWTISSITGSLHRYDSKPPKFFFDEIPDKVKNALEICSYPYNCFWDSTPEVKILEPSARYNLEKMNSRLHFISNRRFFLSLIYASFRSTLFESSKCAFSEIATLQEQVLARADNCLQRSLLVAKTSKSFKKNGVLFIGASIASAEMHAWIIESGSQPDHEDRNWINFQPLLALYYNE